MLVHTETISETTASGAISENTAIKLEGVVRKISVQPETETTQYDLSLTDGNGVVFYNRKSLVGTTTDFEAFNVNSYITVDIANATADEDFVIELEVRFV